VQFYFIRHGQSENNLLWDRSGSSVGRSVDAELTDVGRRQAQALAEFLSGGDCVGTANSQDQHNRAGFGITHLYSSLMVRAVTTASIVAGKLGLPVIAWEDLHETGGIYVENTETSECIGQPGKNRAYFQAHYPRLVLPETLGEDGWWNRPYEAQEQKPLRAQHFWQQLLERHGQTEDRVAAISHGAFYNYLMATVLKMPERDHVWFKLSNTAITRIDFYDQHVELVYTNRVDFLPDDLIT
jgi:2,3-bisphosphoglycerate-dependent phosphoglycerate mutase